MKIITLIAALLFCINAFAQDGDRDGDGVADSQDLCPDIKGTLKNKGCPEENGSKKEIKKEVEGYDSLAFAKELEAILDAEDEKKENKKTVSPATDNLQKSILTIIEDAKINFSKYEGEKLSSAVVAGTFYEDYHKYGLTIGGSKETVTYSGVSATGKKRKYFKSDFIDKNNNPCTSCSKIKNAAEEIILQMQKSSCTVDKKKDALRTTTRLLNDKGETIMEVAVDSNNLLRFIIIYSAGTKLAALN